MAVVSIIIKVSATGIFVNWNISDMWLPIINMQKNPDKMLDTQLTDKGNLLGKP